MLRPINQIWNSNRLRTFPNNTFESLEEKCDAIGCACIIYDVLGQEIYENYTCDFYELRADFNEIMKNFSEEQKKIVELKYGLAGHKPHLSYQIAEILGDEITKSYVVNLVVASKAKFKEYFVLSEKYIFICEELKLRKRISGLEAEYSYKKAKFSLLLKNMEEEIEKSKKELSQLRAEWENPNKPETTLLEKKIEYCNFSPRTYNLLRRQGIKKVGDITLFTEKDFSKARGLGEKSMQEIKKFLADNSLTLKSEESHERETTKEDKENFFENHVKEDTDEWREALKAQPIIICDFSVRTYNCFMRAGIRTIGDLTKLKESDFIRIRNFGRYNMEEVKKFLSENFLSLNPEDEEN